MFWLNPKTLSLNPKPYRVELIELLCMYDLFLKTSGSPGRPLQLPDPHLQAFIWEFPKIGGSLLLGVLIIRILLFRVLYQGPRFSETPISVFVATSKPQRIPVGLIFQNQKSENPALMPHIFYTSQIPNPIPRTLNFKTTAFLKPYLP